MAMEYHLTALEILHILGFTTPTGKDWLENLKQQYHLPLPKVYEEFMEFAANCPLFETSHLWVGKMAVACITITPYTLYEALEENIESEKKWWKEHPEDRKGLYATLSEIPMEQWQKKIENYLLIGSDFGAGIVQFGIPIKDLAQPDPIFYVDWEDTDESVWKHAGKLSDFLLHNLLSILTNEEYETGEEALEETGWKWEEASDFEDEETFFDFCEAQGLDLEEIQNQKEQCSFQTPYFYCYDTENKIFYLGSIQEPEEGRIALYAISPEESDYVFEDLFDD